MGTETSAINRALVGWRDGSAVKGVRYSHRTLVWFPELMLGSL